MFKEAVDMTIRGLGSTVTGVLITNPSTEKHIRNYIATSMKDDRKEAAKELLDTLKNEAKQNTVKPVHFSSIFSIDKTMLVARHFGISPMMIVLILVSFLMSLLQIPNLGLRIGNMLRNKFGISRKAQAAIVEVFNFLSKISKDVAKVFSDIVKFFAPVTPLVEIKPFQDALINLHHDPRTKSAFSRAVNKLEGKEKNFIEKLVTGGKSQNFSRLPFNPRLHTQLSLETGEIDEKEGILTAIKVITNMLSFPGVGQVVMIFVSQFIPISTLTLMLGGSILSISGSVAAKAMDSVQRLRDQMVAYNSLV